MRKSKEDKKLEKFTEDNKELIKLTKRFVNSVNYSKLSKKSSFDVAKYSEEVLEEYHLIYDEHGRLWIYNEAKGIWAENAEKDLNAILRREILDEKHLKKYYVEEVIENIKGITFKRGRFKEPNPNLIPFKDRIYDLEKNKLLSYSYKYFFTCKLPVKIKTKSKDCPTIDKIFEDIVGVENKHMLYELSAYCMYRAYPYQRIFFFIWRREEW